MVLFKEGHYMMSSSAPDTDFTDGQAQFVIPDGSELANKIQAMGIVDLVLDDEGNLIDVQPRSAPIDKAKEIKAQLYEIDLATIRPLRAILSRDFTEADELRLLELETAARVLRTTLSQVEQEG